VRRPLTHTGDRNTPVAGKHISHECRNVATIMPGTGGRDGPKHRLPVSGAAVQVTKCTMAALLSRWSMRQGGIEVVQDAQLSKDDRPLWVAIETFDLAVFEFEDVAARGVHLFTCSGQLAKGKL
jgi:hypothetical protein